MPEGHSLHRLARALRRSFLGQRLDVTSPQGRFAAGAALLDGHVLTASDAWGKHLFLGFSREVGRTPERWLHVHLGLYGAWTFAGDAHFTGPHAIGAPRVRLGETERPLADGDAVDAGDGSPAGAGDGAAVTGGEDDVPFVPPPPRGQVRLRLVGEHGVADLTGPTRCEVLDPAGRQRVIDGLGPDPIRPDTGGRAREAFVENVRRSRAPVGSALMDQSVLAGVGNIYRAELLFRHGLNPWTPGRDVPAQTLREVWDDAVVLMRKGVRTGVIDTMERAHRRSREDLRYTYQRDGRECLLCGTPIAVTDMAGRRVYWCPGCQPAAGERSLRPDGLVVGER